MTDPEPCWRPGLVSQLRGFVARGFRAGVLGTVYGAAAGMLVPILALVACLWGKSNAYWVAWSVIWGPLAGALGATIPLLFLGALWGGRSKFRTRLDGACSGALGMLVGATPAFWVLFGVAEYDVASRFEQWYFAAFVATAALLGAATAYTLDGLSFHTGRLLPWALGTAWGGAGLLTILFVVFRLAQPVWAVYGLLASLAVPGAIAGFVCGSSLGARLARMPLALWALSAATLGVALLVVATQESAQPYQGRSCRYWCHQAHDFVDWESQQRAQSVLVEMLQDSDFNTRFHAAVTLLWVGNCHEAALTIALDACKSEDPITRQSAFGTLGRPRCPPTPEVVHALIAGLGDEDWSTRLEAKRALRFLRPRDRLVFQLVIDLLRSPSPDVRECAATALGEAGEDARDALPALRELLNDPEPGPRLAAERAIRHIEWQPPLIN